MTPLLGTKTPSTPAGDVPAGDNKAAQATALAWRAAQASANSELFTKHESRDTNHGLFSNHSLCGRSVLRGSARGWRHRKPPSGPLHPPASHGFPVRHCSRLFTIVRHCSAKNITPEPVSPLRPHRQHGLFCFHETRDTRYEPRPLLRRGMGRLWRGMGGDRPPHRQHGFMHFTNHETRITAFLVLKLFSLFFGRKPV